MSKVLDPTPPEELTDVDRAPLSNGVPSLGAAKHKPRPRINWARWLTILAVILLVGAVLAYRLAPQAVDAAKPEVKLLAETIASSGVAQGHLETTVGAQAQGVLTQVFVEEGDIVRKGQVLARVQNNVALQQVAQADRSLQTARALLARSCRRSSTIRSQERSG